MGVVSTGLLPKRLSYGFSAKRRLPSDASADAELGVSPGRGLPEAGSSGYRVNYYVRAPLSGVAAGARSATPPLTSPVVPAVVYLVSGHGISYDTPSPAWWCVPLAAPFRNRLWSFQPIA
ncbi:MAG: hypothetical protein QXW94_06215 [Desulfurococcaceae archaeon]